MSQDPFDRAAECERALARTQDPDRRVALQALRDLWIALGNEMPYLFSEDAARRFAEVGKIHARLLGPGSEGD